MLTIAEARKDLVKKNTLSTSFFLNDTISQILDYASQQKKRYKDLMLNIFYTEKKKSHNLDSYRHNK
jgi:hypothetical protein